MLNSYGQTEIGGEIVGWNAADSRAHGETKLGSVGRPHDGVSLRVVDDDGADVPAGEPGELWVLTPALSAGYADGADLSDRLSADGWFRTGDFARIDADGFVWIEGRVSSMINRGGLKVVPGRGRGGRPPAPGGGRRGRGRRARRPPGRGALGLRRRSRRGRVRPSIAAELDDAVPRAPGSLQGAGAASRRIDALPRNEVGKVLARELVERRAATASEGGVTP